MGCQCVLAMLVMAMVLLGMLWLGRLIMPMLVDHCMASTAALFIMQDACRHAIHRSQPTV